MNEEEIFKVNGYELDEEQKQVVLSDKKNILVIAGAGSGKSLTIIGKIKYIINKQQIDNKEILCISFTNDSCNSLKTNLLKNNINIEVLTFHKLGMKILKENNVNVNLTEIDLLQHVVDLFFYETIYNYQQYILYLLTYLKIKHNKKNYKQKYIELLNSKEINKIKNTIIKFIHLYKSNGYKNIYLTEIIKKYKFFNKRYRYLLIIITRIMLEYKNELKNENIIDFDDLILLSTKLVKNTKNLKYKYIIIDEFQDTSLIRYNLIREILLKTNANFLAVGDDYQSIYRFTGCDLYLFLNFKKYFEDSKIYKIQTTYRNSQQLINIAGNFIMKNKMQMKKNLKSHKELSKPVKIVYYKNSTSEFIKLIDYLYKQSKRNILILVRNNNDINSIISNKIIINESSIKYLNHQDMNIRYLTVHKSKGLEEETVIIISLENKDWGFPNKIKDEVILKYILPKKEKCMYSEERRLFYVALTRTKNETYLFVKKDNPSIFVKELLKKEGNNIEIIKTYDKI